MAKLNYKQFGEGEPIIIMHGLYGSSDNWLGIARILMQQFKVFVLDLRNHGDSPHTEDHNYNAMVDDLCEFMDGIGLYAANIIGHSMGGKVAMFYAATFPERVKKLIIVDISPRTYKTDHGDLQGNEHKKILKSIAELDIDNLKSRDEAELELFENIGSKRIVQFLLKNLKRSKNKSFFWKVNVASLIKGIPFILEGLEHLADDLNDFINPVLFIKGGESDYIKEEDELLIKKMFRNCKIETVNGASHWVHAEKTNEFLKMVELFILS